MKRLLLRVLFAHEKNYTEERMARILGPDNDIELVTLVEALILSGGEDFNMCKVHPLPEMKSRNKTGL